jgi:hypothetical protein
MISFVRNIAYIVSNASALKRAGALDTPRRDPRISTPRTMPLDAGRSVFLRSGAWFGAMVLAATAVFGVVRVLDDSNSSSTSTASWEVGGCVSGQSSVHPVSCSGAHSGRIVSFVTVPSRCPANAEMYVSQASGVWCIDSEG